MLPDYDSESNKETGNVELDLFNQIVCLLSQF